MLNTLSVLLDSDHFFHPIRMKDASDHPSVIRRTLGVVLALLSIPFTLGIATGIFAFYAHRKAVKIEKRDLSDLDQRIQKVFGKKIQEPEVQNQVEQFRKILRAVQLGQGGAVSVNLESEELSLTDEMRDELVDAVAEYDRVDLISRLAKKINFFPTDLIKAKSAAMVHAIVETIPSEDRINFVNDPDRHGNTALHLQPNLSVVKGLVECGAKFPEPNIYGESPFHLCTDPAIAAYLIKKFPAIEMEDGERLPTVNAYVLDQSVPPLFTVPPAVMRVFVEKGADVTMLDSNRRYISEYFYQEPLVNEPELLRLILAKAPNERLIDMCIYATWEMMFSEGVNLKTLQVLLEAPKDKTAWKEALEIDRGILREVVCPKVAALLIDCFGVEAFGPIFIGNNLQFQNLSVLKVMIEKGFDPTVRGEYHETIIHRLCDLKKIQNRPEMMSLILGTFKKGRDKADFINTKDRDGYTAIQILIGSGPDIEIAKLLVDNGLDIRRKCSNGAEPIQLLDNDDQNLELAKILWGDLPNDHEWKSNPPPMLQNASFQTWLQENR